MKCFLKKKSLVWAIAGVSLVAVSFLLLILAREQSGFAEWYSESIYPYIVAFWGRIWGVLPFSASELFLCILLIVIGIAAGRIFYKVITKKYGRIHWAEGFSAFLLGVGILFFIYTVNCGINYKRLSFSETAGLELKAYSTTELKEVCLWLTDQVNESSGKVKRDSNGVMKLDDGEGQGAVQAMTDLGAVYPELSGFYPKPKGLTNSWILSVQNLTGIYSPFTVEANYNRDISPFNIPFTACHELSHLRGFMQEEEANFIAWLAGTKSERADFNYSADLMGWIYSTNVLNKLDPQGYAQVRSKLSAKVRNDLAANSKFWETYDTRIAEVSNKVNDTYLKANGEQDGVKSYDRMVDLLVAYYLKNN